jgi:hypothetical protein
MQTWPLLDIREAVADADRNLADVISYVETLQEDTEGQYPPDATQLLAHVTALREMRRQTCPKRSRRTVQHTPIDGHPHHACTTKPRQVNIGRVIRSRVGNDHLRPGSYHLCTIL